VRTILRPSRRPAFSALAALLFALPALAQSTNEDIKKEIAAVAY